MFAKQQSVIGSSMSSYKTFSEMIKPTPRNIEHAIANKFPIVYLLEKSN